MTIRLLCAYDKYPANAIVTLDAGTETGLIAAKMATATLTGGVAYFAPVIAPAPVRGLVGGGPVSLKINEQATVTLPEGQALSVTGNAGAVGAVQRLDAASAPTGTPWVVGVGTLPPIGPIAGTQKLLITCTAGSIDATVGDANVKTVPQSRYMIASNRFGLPTDWATVDTAKNSDGLNDGRTGGTGTAASKWQKRRYFFTTTWTAKGGRFLWANASNSISGVLDSLFTLTIQRAEVRKASDASLVDTIKWSGATSKTLAAGERLWSDALADLSSGGNWFLDVYYTAPDHSSFPACAPIYLNGEVAGESLGTDLSLGSMGTGVGASIGGYFGPCLFVAQGWNGLPTPFVFSDSISDYQFTSATIANGLSTSRGDSEYWQVAYGDPNSSAWNYASSARYSSDITATFTDNLNSLGGENIIDWLADACALLQLDPVFNVAQLSHGRNNLNNSATLASMQALDASFASKISSRYSSVPIWATTITPYTTTSGNMAWTTEAAQTPTNTPNTDSAAGVIRQFNDWRMAGGGGLFAGGIDTAGACRGRAYDKYKEVAFSATLITAITANNTNIATLSAAPPIGECLVFEPGVANVDAANGTRVYAVAKVTANGANWDCTLNGRRGGQANPPTVFDGSTIKLAHAAGVAVAITSAPDGLHPSPARKAEMAKIIIARKAAIAASIAS